jgi:hypothetical protein
MVNLVRMGPVRAWTDEVVLMNVFYEHQHLQPRKPIKQGKLLALGVSLLLLAGILLGAVLRSPVVQALRKIGWL